MTSEPASAGIAVLDACVLFRGRLTDFLLRLAEAGLFDPAWSAAIEAEWMRALQRRRGIPPAVLATRQAAWPRPFPPPPAIPTLARLNAVRALCRSEAQRKDAHVVATALAAEARWIVTDNTGRLPAPAAGAARAAGVAAGRVLRRAHRPRPGPRPGRRGAHRTGLPPAPGYARWRRMSLPGTARWLATQPGFA